MTLFSKIWDELNILIILIKPYKLILTRVLIIPISEGIVPINNNLNPLTPVYIPVMLLLIGSQVIPFHIHNSPNIKGCRNVYTVVHIIWYLLEYTSIT